MLFFHVMLYFSETDVPSMYDIKLNKALSNLESKNRTVHRGREDARGRE